MGAICFLLAVALVSFVNCQAPQQSSAVAFSFGQTASKHFTKGETVTYDKRIQDVNSNIVNGVFVCQTPGVYAFTYYALTETDGELWLELMKNNQLVGSIYGYTVNDYADAGNAAILHLNAGDRVYVKVHDDYTNDLYGDASEVYNTFNGELIRADATELDAMNTYGTVAFYAVLTNNVTVNGTGIAYDTAITNITPGTGYDTSTGVFTAPTDGIYVFHFHSVAHSSEQFWLDLYHNDMYVDSSYGYTSNSFADAGNSVVLNLKKGDTVYVKAHDGEEVHLYGDTDELYTTFSGALLSPTVSQSVAGPGVQDRVHQEVAFSVGLTHNFGTANGDKLLLDRIFVNLGNQFNPTTGIFTAKQSGVYAFHYHVLAQYDKEVWADLRHNYKYINSAYGHTAGSYGPASNSAILELSTGDEVYLDISDYTTDIYGSSDEVYTTFSGYLLYPLVDYHPVVGK